MSFSRPIQWYHSHVDPIWPDGTFNGPWPFKLQKTILSGLTTLHDAYFKGIDRPFGRGVESILIRSLLVNWRLGYFILF
jgi:hypothetical protein